MAYFCHFTTAYYIISTACFQANRFQSSAVRVRRKMWWQNQKVVISISITVILIVVIATLIICWQEGVFKKT